MKNYLKTSLRYELEERQKSERQNLKRQKLTRSGSKKNYHLGKQWRFPSKEKKYE
jgi:hypothetical protein